MLDLLRMFVLLLEVFVYTLLAVTSGAVLWALLQWLFERLRSSHSPRLTP
jgi:hypothetical protein